MDEEWRAISGWERIYEVSNLGRIKRVSQGKNTYIGKILVASPNQKGYLVVSLNHHGQKTKDVHVLVAEAFLPPRPTLEHEVNHINGNKEDCSVENLEWATCLENTQHSINVLGNRKDGESSGMAKLTEADVLEIRTLWDSGNYTQQQLADMKNVDQTTISKIVSRKTWVRF